MVKIRIPRIKEFPRDGRFWRVDWLGALEPNPKVTTEPFFQVILSPFHSDPSSLPPDKLSSVTVTDPDQQEVARIGIGQLPLIDIGSVWRDGIHQGIFAGVSEEFTNLRIDNQTVLVVSAVHKEDGLNIIPYRYYRVGKAGAGSLLVAVEQNGDPYGILIPAMELIRFYYAVSTNLAHALFSGALQHNPDSIIHADRTWYQEEDDRVILGLRQQFTDEEGWVIARILHSKIAAEYCRKIYDGVVKEVINKKYLHVTSGFPFIGNTNLRARIKRFPGADGSKWRRLVLSLEHCTAPMPYSELTVIRDNDGRKANPATDIPENQKKAYTRDIAPKSSGKELALQSSKDTNASLSNVILTVASNRFGALAGREPDKPTKEQCDYKSGGLSNKDFAIDALGTGTGGYGTDEKAIQKVNIAPERNRRKAAAPSFELFIAAVEHLNQQHGISAYIREAGPELEFMPLTKPAGKWQWAYLDSGRRERRHVVIANITIEDQYFCLIEFQLRNNEHCTVSLISSGQRMLRDGELHEILFKCSSKNGVWKNIGDIGLDIIQLRHTWTSHVEFSGAVSDRMAGVA